MPAAYPNNARPAGGRVVAIYFAKEELEVLEDLVKRSGDTRNAIVRRLVREYAVHR